MLIRTKICELLSQTQQATFAQLLPLLNDSKVDVVLALMELLKQGRIAVTPNNGTEYYTLVGDVIENKPTSDAELAALLMDAIKFLLIDVRSGIESSPTKTVFLNAAIPAHDGEAVLKQLRASVVDIGSKTRIGSENVKLVFAAKIG